MIVSCCLVGFCTAFVPSTPLLMAAGWMENRSKICKYLRLILSVVYTPYLQMFADSNIVRFFKIQLSIFVKEINKRNVRAILS
jgi:hypothetical protein